MAEVQIIGDTEWASADDYLKWRQDLLIYGSGWARRNEKGYLEHLPVGDVNIVLKQKPDVVAHD